MESNNIELPAYYPHDEFLAEEFETLVRDYFMFVAEANESKAEIDLSKQKILFPIEEKFRVFPYQAWFAESVKKAYEYINKNRLQIPDYESEDAESTIINFISEADYRLGY